MKVLSLNECKNVNGALTEKQVDSLIGKLGAYSANIGFLGIMYCTGNIGLSALLIGGIGSSVVKMAGTYVFYENKEGILDYINDTKEYVLGA